MHSSDRNLILISIDGLRSEDLANPALRLPHIRALAARGATVTHLETSFPSVTWCVHTTMITGTHPNKHGVLGNRVLDRISGTGLDHFGDRTWDKEEAVLVPTLYDEAQRAGLTTASICWPETRGARTIDWNIPEFYEQHLFERHCTPALWQELRDLGYPVHRYGEWSAQHALGPMQDWLSAEAAVHLLRTRQPRLLMVHFLVADSFQHDYGSGSPESDWAFNYLDDQVGKILAAVAERGLTDRTNVMVLGDHGFAPISRLILPNLVLKQEGLVAVDGHEGVVGKTAWSVSNGGSAFLYILDGARRAELMPYLRHRFSLVEGVDRVIGPEEFGGLGLPQPADHPHQPDLILHAATGYCFVESHEGPAAVLPSSRKGAHGFLPRTPGLLTSLVAAGPDIAQGVTLPAAHLVDVAPTGAALLGIGLPNADGRVLERLLSPEATVMSADD